MALPPILITGASGFLGGRLLERIKPGEFTDVTCTSRSLTPELCARAKRLDANCIISDYPRRALPDDSLNSVDTLIHLAATTGKAPSEQYFQTNFDYTRTLLEQAARCGVRNVLFISSIAAKYKNVNHYPYMRVRSNLLRNSFPHANFDSRSSARHSLRDAEARRGQGLSSLRACRSRRYSAMARCSFSQSTLTI